MVPGSHFGAARTLPDRDRTAVVGHRGLLDGRRHPADNRRHVAHDRTTASRAIRAAPRSVPILVSAPVKSMTLAATGYRSA
jgi:hypothetical protein